MAEEIVTTSTDCPGLAGAICLACRGTILEPESGGLRCPACGAVYPIVDGIPVLILDGLGIFRQDDFRERRSLFFDISPLGKAIRRVSGMLPRLGSKAVSARNFARLADLCLQRGGRPRILIVGGSVGGEGIQALLSRGGLDITESDVSFGLRTTVILDAHHIPYADGTFDAVIAQAVLEHVLDPARCVAEFHRVLKSGGLVYAETPFMQQVHGGAYDFTRYTRSGHRLLFRRFQEVGSGATAGAGTSLAWSYEYFMLSLFGYVRPVRLAIKAFCRLTGAWLSLFDPLAGMNPASDDAASAFWFLGRKSEHALGDSEIVAYHSLSRKT